MNVDNVALFDALAGEMNAHPERYEILGDMDMDLVCVMRKPGGDFRVRLTFAEIGCSGVTEAADGDERAADCWLDADLSVWEAMFGDIAANGRATGRHTLSSLTLIGVPMKLLGADPMGVDKFSRFNQSLQEFFDGAAHVQTASTR